MTEALTRCSKPFCYFCEKFFFEPKPEPKRRYIPVVVKRPRPKGMVYEKWTDQEIVLILSNIKLHAREIRKILPTRSVRSIENRMMLVRAEYGIKATYKCYKDEQ